MKHRIALALFVAGLSASGTSAQVPAGGEFKVNSYSTAFPLMPVVAAAPDGSFVVAWSGRVDDGPYMGIFAQRFDAAGTRRGSEFQVNSFGPFYQRYPSVAADATGSFVVVWASAVQDGDSHGVFGQRYDASGKPRGLEFQINGMTTGSQSRPSVATDAAGNFVVVWEGPGPLYTAVFARRFDASGAPRGSEFRVPAGTAYSHHNPSVSASASGDFVVVWDTRPYGSTDVWARRFLASGMPAGAEFRVNTSTTHDQSGAAVASDAAGNFVVAWNQWDYWQPDFDPNVMGQVFDSSGAPRGSEFMVNSYTPFIQSGPSVASDASGNFIVAWHGFDGHGDGVFARRFSVSSEPRGGEFLVNTYTTNTQADASVAADMAGNFVVAWVAIDPPVSWDSHARRFGGLTPAAVTVDAVASSGSDGNGVLEPRETAVAVAPSWRNVNGAAQTFDGAGLSFSGPPATGVSYELTDAIGAYGTVANGATAPCTDCYQVGTAFGGVRPATHWDAPFTERLIPDAQGQTKPWSLHVGESFTDVPKTSGYYRFVETLLHRKVTAGCSATNYCPGNVVTREQVSVFTLVGKEGAGYLPAACTTPVFADVPASSPFCRFIEELARRGVTAGCGGGNYCPTDAVTREQMPVFVLKVLWPVPLPLPACTTPLFSDVPASSPFCPWIWELVRRGVVSGCGGGRYCPTDPVTREQMAVFIGATFGLTLYGP